MSEHSARTTYCSDLSRQAEEPLIGSASTTKRYLLLEYGMAWGEKALEESELPDAVKLHINEFAKSDQQTKALLIRRQVFKTSPFMLFLASVAESDPFVLGFELEEYEHMLDMDFARILEDPGQYGANRWEKPLLLVCTNGRRDLCCTRYGLPVLNSLQHAAAGSPTPLIWQSTHMGGHRFAANLLVLPYGLLYGRVDPESAMQILASAHQRMVYLPNLRGRTAYPPAAQAAELQLHQETGEQAIEGFELLEVLETGSGAWQVKFRPTKSEEIYLLNVHAEESEQQIFESCRLDKSTPLVRYAASLQS